MYTAPSGMTRMATSRSATARLKMRQLATDCRCRSNKMAPMTKTLPDERKKALDFLNQYLGEKNSFVYKMICKGNLHRALVPYERQNKTYFDKNIPSYVNFITFKFCQTFTNWLLQCVLFKIHYIKILQKLEFCVGLHNV